METPPRAWGRHNYKTGSIRDYRNTPTSVGKTIFFPRSTIALQKHPHERGEDLSDAGEEIAKGGNTPTSVGKTLSLCACSILYWKHPHERGEDTGFYWC